jgi:oligopeptide/dipeptide ABC transporter ATP-binding protein
VAGVVPQPRDWPAGCRFSSRCERVFDRCRAEPPAATQVGDGHAVRCHAVADEEGV